MKNHIFYLFLGSGTRFLYLGILGPKTRKTADFGFVDDRKAIQGFLARYEQVKLGEIKKIERFHVLGA